VQLSLRYQVTRADEFENPKRRAKLWLPVHSINRNGALLQRAMNASTSPTLQRTTGVVALTSSSWSFLAGLSDDSYGIVVGTGAPQSVPASWNVNGKVAQGVTPTTLQHSAMSISVVTLTLTASTWMVSRVFTPNAVDSILVTQIGLVSFGGGSATTRYMVVFDNLAGPVDFGNWIPRTVAYQFSMG